jgi:uncharacterized Zn finger protein (UPF0148 family)
MECKHPYFHYVDGVLVCTQCGKPSESLKLKIEDKIDSRRETKQATSTAKKTKR